MVEKPGVLDSDRPALKFQLSLLMLTRCMTLGKSVPSLGLSFFSFFLCQVEAMQQLLGC